jgi:hypothetical protein
MTPKEKAKEMVNKFYYYVESISESQQQENAKNCALIAVDEIIKESPSKIYWQTYDDETPSAITYWQEVKEEINKL